jgi:hypothetical protein
MLCQLLLLLLRTITPHTARVCRYTNQDNLDFATAQEIPSVQDFTLNEDPRGILEYPVKCATALSLLAAPWCPL